MLTCYITNNVFIIDSHFKLINYYIVLSIPVIIAIYSVYMIIRLFYFAYYHPNSVLKNLLLKYLGYSLVYIIFYFPQLLLHFLTIKENKHDKTYNQQMFIYVNLNL